MIEVFAIVGEVAAWFMAAAVLYISGSLFWSYIRSERKKRGSASVNLPKNPS